ncbi:MAG: GNAT family N-acetyltransferase [Lachnospiraceae bacterium]|nr:GNAT family N-acetyltransferase [Lachnospiraceae bacterium]
MDILRVSGELPDRIKDILFVPFEDGNQAVTRLELVEEGKLAGFAAFSTEGPVERLEMLYVLPEYRRRGFAMKVMAEIANFGEAQGCRLLTADFLHSMEDMEEFLLSCGFTIMGSTPVFAFPFSGFIENEYLRKNLFDRKLPGHTKCFSELSREEMSAALGLLSKNGYDVSRLGSASFNRALSFCAWQKNTLQGVIVCFGFGKDVIIEYFTGHDGAVFQLALLFRELLKVVNGENHEGGSFLISGENRPAVSLMQNLLKKEPERGDLIVHGYLEL